MIFLSHNHRDKPLVEQVALRLSSAYGKSRVFYDSWSIQPGEGIIDRMSEALGQCTHFFFFVSSNSLKSRMVSLEWQNALIRATMGKCKLIPVRCDNSELPPIMAQTLYIDLYTVGLDAAVAQICDVITGEINSRITNTQFRNLYATAIGTNLKKRIQINARFFLEPIPSFSILADNPESDLNLTIPDAPQFIFGYERNIPIDGNKTNAFIFGTHRGITPSFPLRVEIESKTERPLLLRALLHQKSSNRWEHIILFSISL